MAEVVITNIAGCGPDSDQLRITGTVDGRAVQAEGWFSATQNHYPPDAYDEDGHRDPDAIPRKMTESEVVEWAVALLVAADRASPDAVAQFPDFVLQFPAVTDAPGFPIRVET